MAVVNPFAEQLTFLDDRTRTRRDHTKYLTLIRCVALLHQYQRPVQAVAHDGKTLAYIEATIEDVAAANRLAHEVLGRGLDEMPPQTRRLLELIERMVAEKCAAKKLERSDCRFRARQVREFAGWGNSQLHVHLQRLVALEYVTALRADHGQGFVYELVYDGGGKDGRRFFPGLIDIEALRRPGLAAAHPGQNGDHPAPVRPVSGPVPGGVSEAGSPSENAPASAKTRRNAHLDRAALAVAS